jgi:hypothetical protein
MSNELEQALRETRDFQLFEQVTAVLEHAPYTTKSMQGAVIPELVRRLGMSRLGAALVVAEHEWERYGGPWLDALEDQCASSEVTALRFVNRYGERFEDWDQYVAEVLADRKA